MADFPELATERLVLRQLTAADARTVEQLAGAREVADTTLNIPHPYPAGAATGWIATQPRAWEAGTSLTLAICRKESPQALVGAISLAINAPQGHAELGYWIALHEWGRGYATEAASALITFAFASLGLHRVQARHFSRNPASGRVMQKLGMRQEGILREAYQRDGVFQDVVVYGLLVDEWKALPSGAA